MHKSNFGSVPFYATNDSYGWQQKLITGSLGNRKLPLPLSDGCSVINHKTTRIFCDRPKKTSENIISVQQL